MGGLIAGAVVARQGEVLLIRRARPVGSLVWSFPAGKVEPGESVTDAAAREALEETGMSVAPVVALGSRVHPVTGRMGRVRRLSAAGRSGSGGVFAGGDRGGMGAGR